LRLLPAHLIVPIFSSCPGFILHFIIITPSHSFLLNLSESDLFNFEEEKKRKAEPSNNSFWCRATVNQCRCFLIYVWCYWCEWHHVVIESIGFKSFSVIVFYASINLQQEKYSFYIKRTLFKAIMPPKQNVHFIVLLIQCKVATDFATVVCLTFSELNVYTGCTMKFELMVLNVFTGCTMKFELMVL